VSAFFCYTRNMKTKIIIGIVALLVLCAYFFLPAPTQAPAEENTPIIANVPQIGPESFREDTERYVINISIPEVEGDQAFLELRNDIQMGVEFFREIVDEYNDPMSAPWILDIEVEEIQSNTLVSYLVNWYEYTGGAHGNIVVESYNYNLETGDRVSVGDIVSSLDHLYTFAALADKELTIHYPEGSSGENPENWNTWYADNESVTFIFSPYQIAAYAVGTQKFRMVATGMNAELFNQEYFK